MSGLETANPYKRHDVVSDECFGRECMIVDAILGTIPYMLHGESRSRFLLSRRAWSNMMSQANMGAAWVECSLHSCLQQPRVVGTYMTHSSRFLTVESRRPVRPLPRAVTCIAPSRNHMLYQLDTTHQSLLINAFINGLTDDTDYINQHDDQLTVRRYHRNIDMSSCVVASKLE